MREFGGLNPYNEWRRSGGRLNVEMEREFANINNWTTGVKEYDPTGRVRVIIEGEAELVNELLGKNFIQRKNRIDEEGGSVMAKMAERYDEQSLAIHVVDAYGASRELARCSDDALTFTLRTLTSEGQITSTDDVGILSLEDGTWLVSPYPASVFGRRS